jgi:hypothetical protein
MREGVGRFKGGYAGSLPSGSLTACRFCQNALSASRLARTRGAQPSAELGECLLRRRPALLQVLWSRASSSWAKGRGPGKFANPSDDAALSHSSWAVARLLYRMAARCAMSRARATKAYLRETMPPSHSCGHHRRSMQTRPKTLASFPGPRPTRPAQPKAARHARPRQREAQGEAHREAQPS